MSGVVLAWLSKDNSPCFLSESEPCHQQDGITIVLRGYIANRNELIVEHTLPRQSTDNQIVFALYKRFGAELTAAKIAGPSSWVLWDRFDEKIIVVSDRMGLTPIYYTQRTGNLWISSVPGLLFHHSNLERCANPMAIVARLCGMPMPEGQTLFKNVFVLPPATIWRYSKQQSRQIRYWRPTILPTLRLKNDQEYAEALRALLVRVANEHIPKNDFALTLSSGMDSSSIAGALRLARPRDHIPCISWVMPELPAANEEEWIKETSARLQLDLSIIQADQHWSLKPIELAKPIADLVYHQEAWVATFQEMNRKGYRTLISGAPGDLCFGDYISCYPDLLISLQWKKLMGQIQKEFSSAVREKKDWKTPIRLTVKPLYRYLTGGSTTPNPHAPAWLHPTKAQIFEQIKNINKPPHILGFPARVERWRHLKYPGTAQALSCYQELADYFEIQFCHPLYDHRIIEFALSLPSEQTYHAGIQKYIVRNSMKGILPDNVIELKRKILPTDLFHRGLRERSIKQARFLLTNMRLAEMGYVLPEKIDAAYQEYLNGGKNTDFYHVLLIESQLRLWN